MVEQTDAPIANIIVFFFENIKVGMYYVENLTGQFLAHVFSRAWKMLTSMEFNLITTHN